MPEISSHISDLSQSPSVQGDVSLLATAQTPASPTDASSIQTSEMVGAMLILPASVPQLIPPEVSSANLDASIELLRSSQKFVLSSLSKFIDTTNEIKQAILDKWSQNIQQIKEDVERMLKSATYRHNEEIRRKGSEAPDLTHALEQAEKASAATLPMMASMVVGGSLMLTSMDVSATSATPVSGSVEMVEKITTLYPQLTTENVLPLVNLMIAAPLYLHAWAEASSKTAEGGEVSALPMAQGFAKDVLKMMGNPAWIIASFVNRMEGAAQMSDAQKQEMGLVVQLILGGVALGLLYSAEVGTASGGKFGGMQPQELRDLLNGKLPSPFAGTKEGFIGTSLLGQMRALLATLSPEKSTAALEAILQYLGNARALNQMRTPSKVFQEVFSYASFQKPDKTLEGSRV